MTEHTEGQASSPAESTTAANEPQVIDLDALQPDADPDEQGGENESPAKDEKPDDEKSGKADDEPERKKLSGAQRAKLREQRLLDQIAERDRELSELRAKSDKSAEQAGDDDRPPKESDYEDFFKYQRDAAAFEARRVAREEARKALDSREESERATREATARRQRDLDHADRVEDARGVIADFDQVMTKMKGVEVRNDVIDEIKSSDKSALITYHLAQNPDRIEALNQMSPRELAREIGRLEATLKLPEPKKQTSAPPPLSSVKGGAAPASPDADLEAWLTKTYGKRA